MLLGVKSRSTCVLCSCAPFVASSISFCRFLNASIHGTWTLWFVNSRKTPSVWRRAVTDNPRQLARATARTLNTARSLTRLAITELLDAIESRDRGNDSRISYRPSDGVTFRYQWRQAGSAACARTSGRQGGHFQSAPSYTCQHPMSPAESKRPARNPVDNDTLWCRAALI